MTGIFAKTFALVFVAELGDKTQLAALALAASTPGGKWAIFAGSALALALTSLIAVLAGEALARAAGAERILKIVSGAVFIVFGVATLAGAVKS